MFQVISFSNNYDLLDYLSCYLANAASGVISGVSPDIDVTNMSEEEQLNLAMMLSLDGQG